MRTAFSRQKSYVDLKKKDVSFSITDMVFLEIFQMKKVMRFDKQGKLAPRYMRPFEIHSREDDVAYRLKLPPELSWIYPVFHVFILRKYIFDPSYVFQHQTVELSEDLTYKKYPVAIVDR